MTSIRLYVEQYIPKDLNAEDFALWAFGSSYIIFDEAIHFMNAWNVLHSDVFHIHGDAEVCEDIKTMINLWYESLKI